MTLFAQSLSDSITNYLCKTTSGAPWQTMTVGGEALASETYIQIKWIWFTLPASVVIMSCSLLLIMVFPRKRTQASLWKSSVLPTFFTSLGQNTLQTLQADDGKMTQSKMAHMAERIKLYLDAKDDVLVSFQTALKFTHEYPPYQIPFPSWELSRSPLYTERIGAYLSRPERRLSAD